MKKANQQEQQKNTKKTQFIRACAVYKNFKVLISPPKRNKRIDKSIYLYRKQKTTTPQPKTKIHVYYISWVFRSAFRPNTGAFSACKMI